MRDTAFSRRLGMPVRMRVANTEKGTLMGNGRGIARLGMLAVGLGLGAAVAQAPVAPADSSTDWLSSVDTLLGGALPAPATSGLDLAISFDGYSLVSDGSANAYTTSGDYDLAIAYGANSQAEAVDGVGDTAIANGNYAEASAYDGTGDYALADGSRAYADAGGGTGANYDSAIDIGNNDPPATGVPDGAYAGDADLDGGGSTTGSYDTSIDIGNNTNDTAEGVGGQDGAFAGAGGLGGMYGNGDHDTAVDVGNNSGFYDGSYAINGDGNYASESGDTTGQIEGVLGGNGGDDNTVVSDISYTLDGYRSQAGDGDHNYAYGVGPENSQVYAVSGDSNTSYLVDPFGSTVDNATAAQGHFDLAALLFTDGTAAATNADNVYDVVTAAGSESGTAAATSGGLLGELLSLF
jgi:hypothetical protein